MQPREQLVIQSHREIPPRVLGAVSSSAVLSEEALRLGGSACEPGGTHQCEMRRLGCAIDRMGDPVFLVRRFNLSLLFRQPTQNEMGHVDLVAAARSTDNQSKLLLRVRRRVMNAVDPTQSQACRQ